MNFIHADLTASVTELKKNPSALIANAAGSPIAILNNNSPAAYLVPAETYAAMIEALEDLELTKVAEQRLEDGGVPVKVNLNDL